MRNLMIPVMPGDDDRFCARECPWVPTSTGGRCGLFQSVLGGGPAGQLERCVYCREATAKVAPKLDPKDSSRVCRGITRR